MRLSVRRILTALGLAFAVYLAVRSLVWVGGTVHAPALSVTMTAAYLAVVVICVFVEGEPFASRIADGALGTAQGSGRGRLTRLPRWACILALAAVVVIPNGANVALDDSSRATGYGTWYVGGIGLLMIVLIVRGRPWSAWIGTALLAVITIAWLSAWPALTMGLVGSVTWMLVAQIVLLSMDRAALDEARLSELQRAASAWQAAQQGRQRERRVTVQRALAVAGPILSRAIEQSGRLDDRERAEARIAEGQLRDELRGALLLDDGVRAELDAARRRGASVSVVDEGGLDGLDENERAQIRAQLAAAVHAAGSDRLYIRSSTHPEIAVTVVGRSAAGSSADEDDVDLWREIPRPR